MTVAWLAHDADPAVSTIHQATLATGLLSRKKRGRVGQWDLTYSPDSRALKSKVTKQMILKGEHPLAVGNPWGIHMPQVYGVHDSAGLGGAGMLPAINISHSATLGYYWLVSQGYLVGVPQVFVDGIDQSGDFDTVRAVRAGKMLTYISFVGEGAAPGAAAVITVDAEGLETEGDGTGAGIANPVAQLRHWLTAFGIGDYKQGSWPAMNVLIDGDSWAAAETWAGKYGLEGAMYVGGVREQIEAIDVVNRWLETWPQIRLYWTHLGKLAMGLVQPVLRDSNVSAEHFIRLEEPEAFDLQPDDDTALIITRVNQTYLYDVGAVKYWQSLDLQDVSRDEEIADSIAAVYSAARLE
ncbi:MAG: hypothetical protein A2V88_16005 [Elusimicrobia bacterium RBG_16_66_12]|nr:MAG: hypothetical protein A2V88_16005 [Elusimicrobia bacterium RBG_16_66_12]